jgi:hypothetical protein
MKKTIPNILTLITLSVLGSYNYDLRANSPRDTTVDKVDWYDGEIAPNLITGYLSINKNCYLFTQSNPNNNQNDDKENRKQEWAYIVKFYDEDAEREAIEIAKVNKDRITNIQLLGHPTKENGHTVLEVIYGLAPGEKFKK